MLSFNLEQRTMLLFKFVVKTILFGLFLLLAGPVQAQAQNKIQPPPTRMDVPFDSISTRTPEAGKVESEKTELELPDVMIFGVDQSTRKSGLKQTPTLQLVETMGVQNLYQPMETRSSLPTKVELYRQQPVHNIQAAVLAGSFGHVNVTGLYRHPIRNGGAYGFVDYGRWDGQFKNSDFDRGVAKISGNYQFSPESAGNANLSFQSQSYGLYGADLSDGQYKAQTIKFATQLHHTFSPLVTGDLNIHFANSNGKIDTVATLLAKNSDFWFILNPSFDWRVHQVQLTTSVDFMNEVMNFADSTESSKNSFLTVKFKASHQLNKKLMLTGALGWQSLTSELGSNRRVLWAESRLVAMFSHLVGGAISVHSGLDYFTLTGLREINPYIKNQIPLTPERTKFRIQALLEMAPSFASKLYVRLDRRYSDDVRFWFQDSTRLFDQSYLDNLTLTEIELGTTLTFGQTSRISASFITYSDKRQEKKTQQIDQLPYRPRYRLPVHFSFDLPMQTNLTARGTLTGPRRIDLNQPAELKTYFDLGLSLAKQIGDHFNLSLHCQNLLNDNYQIWHHFPELGTQLLLQARAQF